jgi:hypothetical protein
MLCDDAKCDDCGWRGCDCTCPSYKGPSWSPERRKYNEEKAAYEKMQWWNKIEYWDHILLMVWQSQGQNRLVPTFDQASTFNMKRNPNPCFVD